MLDLNYTVSKPFDTHLILLGEVRHTLRYVVWFF